jgi:hypothetical protein
MEDSSQNSPKTSSKCPSFGSESAWCLTWNGVVMACPEDLREKHDNAVYYWDFLLHRLHNEIYKIVGGAERSRTLDSMYRELTTSVDAIQSEYVERIVRPLFASSAPDDSGEGRWFFGTEVSIPFSNTLTDKSGAEKQVRLVDYTYWFPKIDIAFQKNSCNAVDDAKGVLTKNMACTTDITELERVWGIKHTIIRRCLDNKLSDEQLVIARDISMGIQTIHHGDPKWWVYESPAAIHGKEKTGWAGGRWNGR